MGPSSQDVQAAQEAAKSRSSAKRELPSAVAAAGGMYVLHLMKCLLISYNAPEATDSNAPTSALGGSFKKVTGSKSAKYVAL